MFSPWRDCLRDEVLLGFCLCQLLERCQCANIVHCRHLRSDWDRLDFLQPFEKADAPSSGWRPCPHPAARSSSSTQCLSHGRMRNLPAAQLPLGLWHFLRSRRNCNVWQLWRRCVADIWKRLFKKQSHIYFTQITVFPLIVRPRLSLETPDCIRQRLVLETRIIFGTLLILE